MGFDYRDLHNYLDNVFGHNGDWPTHLHACREFYVRVREANLALKPTKCFIGYTELVFLGHKVGQVGVALNDYLISKIKQATPPTIKKELRVIN